MKRKIVALAAMSIPILGNLRAEESVEDAQPNPKAFDPERWPLDRSVDSWISVKLFDSDRHEMLRFQLVDNLWFSIVDLDRFVKAREGDKRFQDRAAMLLIEIAKYFGEHPKRLRKPDDFELAQRIQEEVEGARQRVETGDPKAMVEAGLHDGIDPLIEGLDGVFSGYLAQVYARDLMTQAVVDRINSEQGAVSDPPPAASSEEPSDE